MPVLLRLTNCGAPRPRRRAERRGGMGPRYGERAARLDPYRSRTRGVADVLGGAEGVYLPARGHEPVAVAFWVAAIPTIGAGSVSLASDP